MPGNIGAVILFCVSLYLLLNLGRKVYNDHVAKVHNRELCRRQQLLEAKATLAREEALIREQEKSCDEYEARLKKQLEDIYDKQAERAKVEYASPSSSRGSDWPFRVSRDIETEKDLFKVGTLKKIMKEDK